MKFDLQQMNQQTSQCPSQFIVTFRPFGVIVSIFVIRIITDRQQINKKKIYFILSKFYCVFVKRIN